MAPKRDKDLRHISSYGNSEESSILKSKSRATSFKPVGNGDGYHRFLPIIEDTLSESVKVEIAQKLEALNLMDSGGQSQSSQTNKGPCAVCGLPCKSCCGGCKRVFYCAKKHQQAHWSKHKLDCRPFSIPPQYPPGWSTNTFGHKIKIPRGKDEGSSLELKYMVVTREVEGGMTLFSEKPLIIVPNYPNLLEGEISKKCCCLGCFKQFQIPGRFVPLDVCKICSLPLCADCLKGMERQEYRSGYPDCAHTLYQCNAVADAVMKNREFMTHKNHQLGQNAELIKDFTILRILLLYKTSFNRWESFIHLKGNVIYGKNLKFPTDELKDWLAADYPISENYLKGLKDKDVVLEEVIKIFAIFSQVCLASSHLRVLYPTQVWIPHACSPNSQPYFREGDTSHTMYVKTIETIRSDGVVTMNYFRDYDEGNSKAAVRLFTSSGLYCAETRCPCRMSSLMDTSVGIRCNMITTRDTSTTTACSGYLSPVMEPPNPDKQSLGLLIYVKSKSWNCNKCRRSEKFCTIQKQVKEIGEIMKQELEKYSVKKDVGTFSNLRELLSKHLSDQHWLHWNLNKTTLTLLDNIVGNGQDMLALIIGLSPGETRSDFLKLVRHKVEIYGAGIIEPTTSTISQIPGVLSLLAKRHGRLSSKRAIYLFDAFYANLIVFAETFKNKYVNLSNNTSTITEAVTDALRCLQVLIRLVEEASESLSLIATSEEGYKATMCCEMLQVLKSVHANALKNRPSVLQYIREFLEIYSAADAAFIATTLSKFKPMKDELEDLFDVDGRQYPSLTFGPVYGIGQEAKKKKEKGFKGGKGDSKSPTFENMPAWHERTDYQWDSDEDFGSLGDVLGDDMDDPFSASVDYYEQLLNNSIREKMYAEEVLRNLFK